MAANVSECRRCQC